MSTSPYHELSRRERQVMEVVHRLAQASVADVREGLADRPSYNAVRVTLANLEEKGYLRHAREGRRYLYRAVQRAQRTRSTAARSLLTTFFGDSVPDAVSALIDARSKDLSEEDLDALEELVESARRRKEGGR